MDSQQSNQSASSPVFQTVRTARSRPSRNRLSRRRLFNRAALATTGLALAGGNTTVLAACSSITSASTSTDALDQPAAGGKVREYWIQADSYLHNLVPTGMDDMTNTGYKPNQTSYWAIGYRAYTENWGKRLPGDDNIGPNTGMPGPVLRAEVGDVIRVHFRNNDTYYKFPHSMHSHGLVYTPANDGGWIARDGNKPGTAVEVGQSFTYEWNAAASSVGTWPYHDHSKPAMIAGATGSGMSEMNATSGTMDLGAELGLYGIVAVTDRTTPNVDREFILCFQDIYETDVPQLSQDFDCFNGFAFLGNTPTFQAKVGEHVRWRIMALGTDFHVFHIHGHRWLSNGAYIDSQMLGPSTTLTVEYVEDNPGTWLYHCHVNEHMMGGMVGYYISQPA